MPTKSDIERLSKLAKGVTPAPPPRELADAPEFTEERGTHSRDSNVHVSVHLGGGEKKSGSEPPSSKKKHPIQQAAESPWSKIVAALLLGAGGGEGHRLLSPTGMVDRAELSAVKEELVRELGKEDERVNAVKQAGAAALTECRASRDEDRKAMYALGRYLYFVLPKTGVLVTLPQDVHRPDAMDFHPPPLFGSVTPNGAKPIQPAETFPLPFPPDQRNY